MVVSFAQQLRRVQLPQVLVERRTRMKAEVVVAAVFVVQPPVKQKCRLTSTVQQKKAALLEQGRGSTWPL